MIEHLCSASVGTKRTLGEVREKVQASLLAPRKAVYFWTYARCSIKYDRLHLIKLAALSENIKIKLKIKVKISTYKISFSLIHVVRFWEEDARKDSKRHESASL